MNRSLKGKKYSYPLRGWGMGHKECIDYCLERDMLNPLYEKGFTRLGCWCCPRQSNQSLETLRINYPDLWDRLLQYESDSPQGFKPNVKLRDNSLEGGK